MMAILHRCIQPVAGGEGRLSRKFLHNSAGCCGIIRHHFGFFLTIPRMICLLTNFNRARLFCVRSSWPPTVSSFQKPTRYSRIQSCYAKDSVSSKKAGSHTPFPSLFPAFKIRICQSREFAKESNILKPAFGAIARVCEGSVLDG